MLRIYMGFTNNLVPELNLMLHEIQPRQESG